MSPLPVGLGASLVWLAGLLTVLLTTGIVVYSWAFSPRYAALEQFLADLQRLSPGVTEAEITGRFGPPQCRLPLPAGSGARDLGFGQEGRWLVQGACRETPPRFAFGTTVLAYDASWGVSLGKALVFLDATGRLLGVWLALG